MVKPLPVGVVFVIVRGNCKKFGIQGSYRQDRNTLHMLLFRTEGWKDNTIQINWVVRDIKFYYQKYKEGNNLFEHITRYVYDKDAFWKTTDGRYYHTLATHIEELYNTVKLRESMLQCQKE